MIRRAAPPKRRRSTPRKGRVRAPKYLAWIRSLPCAVCLSAARKGDVGLWHPGQESSTEAAHVGRRGLSQKSSDRETIPLCAYHHRIGPFSYHNRAKDFFDIWDLDKEKLIADLNRRYEQEVSSGNARNHGAAKS